MDRCALNAGVSLWDELSVHTCEGEARLLCRGEANTSMVALCLLAQEAKGHETGINYRVRAVCVVCVSVCEGGTFQILILITLIIITIIITCF